MAWASIPMRMLGNGEWGVGSGEWGKEVTSSSPHSPLPTPHSLLSAIQLIQFTHRLVVSLEPAFVRAEGRCVINATAVDGARAMFHMKHFVIEYEFYQEFRERGAVKRTTDDYCLVNVIVVSQNPLGAPRAPAKDGFRQFVAEVTPVEPGEEFIQIIDPADGAGQHFAAALLPRQIGRALHLRVIGVLSI